MIQRAAFINPLETCFQPIFETLNGERVLHAVECLTRGPHGSTLEQAPQLFDYVRRRHLEPEIDRMCIAQGLRAAGGGGTHRISVNVHPVTLAVQGDFPAFLVRECVASGQSVVYEYERSAANGHQCFGIELVPVPDAEGAVRHVVAVVMVVFVLELEFMVVVRRNDGELRRVRGGWVGGRGSGAVVTGVEGTTASDERCCGHSETKALVHATSVESG